MMQGRGPWAAGIPAGSARAAEGSEEMGRRAHGIGDCTGCPHSRWQMVSSSGFGMEPIP